MTRQTPLNQSDSGFIALIGVLVIVAGSVIAVITLLTGAINNQAMTLQNHMGAAARKHADSCAEEALQWIRDDTAYVGSGTLTFGDDSCNYTITSTGASSRSISSTGLSNEATRKLTLSVTIGASSISVSSWQETP